MNQPIIRPVANATTDPAQAAGPAVVVGAGTTGVAVARFLVAQGLSVHVLDSRDLPPGADALRDLGVKCTFGSLDAAVIMSASMVVLSPGVPRETPAVAAAIADGHDVIGDIELFARCASAPTVGITGSNGKSTVTTMVGAILAAAGRRTTTGGNLGPPALELLARENVDVHVLELSSFQLESTRSLELEAGAILNLSEDHLDRYADMAAYAAAKARIAEMSATVVVPPSLAGLARDGGARRIVTFSAEPGSDADYRIERIDGARWLVTPRGPLMAAAGLGVPGLHNQANALAAAALVHALDVDDSDLANGLSEFSGLAHRCERVPSSDGRRWINDSKGTNIGATAAAIEGLAGDPGELILIAGGQGKGADFSALRETLRGRVRLAVLFGEDADRIASAVSGVCEVVTVAELESACARAAMVATVGDTILFSPACASFDQFANYGARGDRFRELVAEMSA